MLGRPGHLPLGQGEVPLLHTPMVAAWTGGRTMGGARYTTPGGLGPIPVETRSQRVGGLEIGDDRVSVGMPTQARKLAQLSSESHCSATSSN